MTRSLLCAAVVANVIAADVSLAADDPDHDTLSCKIDSSGENYVISCGKPLSQLTKGIRKASPSQEQVAKVVQQHTGKLRSCYANTVRATPRLSIMLEVELEVSPQGDVTDTMFHKPVPDNTELKACITEQTKSWRFPKPEDGRPFSVLLPLVLDPHPDPTK